MEQMGDAQEIAALENVNKAAMCQDGSGLEDVQQTMEGMAGPAARRHLG
jgi:hypothetical protein